MGKYDAKVIIVAVFILTLSINCFQAFAMDELWIIDRSAYMPNNLGLTTDSENNVIVAYRLHDSMTLDSMIKIEKVSCESGKRIWWNTTEFDGIGYARDVATDSQDNFVVVGDSDMNGDTFSDWVIVKYDSDGNEVWQEMYDSGGYDLTFVVTVDLNDDIIIAGYNSSSFIARRYNSSGHFEDEMTYNGIDASPNDVTTDDEGNVIVVGREGSGDLDYFVVKYDINGDQQWNQTYHRYGTDIANGVVTDSEGNIYVTGESRFEREGAIPYYGYLTLKYNSSGDLLWTKAYDNEEWSSYAYEIAIDQYEYIYVTGTSNGEILTIRYSPDGEENLVRRYKFEVDDGIGMRVAIDSNQNLIVLGYKNEAGQNKQFYVMKYLLSTHTQARLEALETENAELRADLEALNDTVSSMRTTHIALAVRGSNNGIYWRKYDGSTWGDWSRLPGSTVDSPAIAVMDGNLHMVVIGTNYRLYHGWVDLETDEFSGWSPLSGSTPSIPILIDLP